MTFDADICNMKFHHIKELATYQSDKMMGSTARKATVEFRSYIPVVGALLANGETVLISGMERQILCQKKEIDSWPIIYIREKCERPIAWLRHRDKTC